MDGMGNRLRELRGDRRQAEIAKALGIGNSSYTMYENDQREPNYTLLCKIAEFYEVSTDYLLGRTECKSPDIEVQTACERYGLSEDALYKLEDLNLNTSAHFNKLIDCLIVNISMHEVNLYKWLFEIQTHEKTNKTILPPSIKHKINSDDTMCITLREAKYLFSQLLTTNILNILLGNNPTSPDEEEF